MLFGFLVKLGTYESGEGWLRPYRKHSQFFLGICNVMRILDVFCSDKSLESLSLVSITTNECSVMPPAAVNG